MNHINHWTNCGDKCCKFWASNPEIQIDPVTEEWIVGEQNSSKTNMLNNMIVLDDKLFLHRNGPTWQHLDKVFVPVMALDWIPEIR